MNKTTFFQFEAKPNAQGEFVCDQVVELSSTEQSKQSSGFKSQQQSYQQQDQQQQHQRQQDYQQPFGSTDADEVFRNSYQSNFTAQNSQYVDQMRSEFEQMRKSMLDQMESFTFVKNMRS